MRYELTHDSIANQIYEKAAGDLRNRRKIERRIKESYEAFQDRKVKPSRQDIDYFLAHIDSINVNDLHRSFVREIDQDLKSRMRWKHLAIGTALILFVCLTIWGWSARAQANTALKNLREEVFSREQQRAISFLEIGDVDAAISHLDSAMILAHTRKDTLVILDYRGLWVQLSNLIEEGDTLLESIDFKLWYSGLQRFERADSLRSTPAFRTKISAAKAKIQAAFEKHINSAKVSSNYHNYVLADSLLRDALRLRPLEEWSVEERHLLERVQVALQKNQ